MSRAANREEVAERVRTLLEECVGSELGGYDSLRATLEIEIAKSQIARLDRDIESGDMPGDSPRTARYRAEFAEALAKAEADLAAEERETAEFMARIEGWKTESRD
ncbi:hypothetical protein [Streptomyces sp. NPDC058657]|uniref:hypothetical protein n=1 Tax=unclassified Streptomyces TaxID=2593676 RepID=UPI00365334F9